MSFNTLHVCHEKVFILQNLNELDDRFFFVQLLVLYGIVMLFNCPVNRFYSNRRGSYVLHMFTSQLTVRSSPFFFVVRASYTVCIVIACVVNANMMHLSELVTPIGLVMCKARKQGTIQLQWGLIGS